ncbi:hypothetical protein J5J83_01615 [Azoarcus sp. L1K30]|uniref:hypothetical protein n=1 Tax=Azoarcus sp. L1K30 TaxID=2820277 RepID=UPI001B834776|nr:hypothetical protein [Azoarcus sp. L1K30]MBR0564812.1 hypothetical protein [Azoarcus sp. L1K30]
MSLAILGGCSILFDSPSADDVPSVSIDHVMVRKARETSAGGTFPIGGGIGAGAPANDQAMASALSIETGRSGSDASFLVIETSVTGEVFVDGQAIGLVQDASRARLVTLIPGKHEVRVERLHAAPVLAQFYIDSGERITLRWESRQSR